MEASHSENKPQYAAGTSKEQKQSYSRNLAQAFRNTTNLPKADESVLSLNRPSKYANPYIYHRKTNSKILGTEEDDVLQKTSTFGGT